MVRIFSRENARDMVFILDSETKFYQYFTKRKKIGYDIHWKIEGLELQYVTSISDEFSYYKGSKKREVLHFASAIHPPSPPDLEFTFFFKLNHDNLRESLLILIVFIEHLSWPVVNTGKFADDLYRMLEGIHYHDSLPSKEYNQCLSDILNEKGYLTGELTSRWLQDMSVAITYTDWMVDEKQKIFKKAFEGTNLVDNKNQRARKSQEKTKITITVIPP